MEVFHVTKKEEYINTLEKFHSYMETKNDNQINEKCTAVSNTPSDIVIWNDVTIKAW
jgi:hypothetical protein